MCFASLLVINEPSFVSFGMCTGTWRAYVGLGIFELAAYVSAPNGKHCYWVKQLKIRKKKEKEKN